MKKTLYGLAVSVLFFGGAALALADTQPMGFWCDTYTSTFSEGQAYIPTDGGTCNFTIPSLDTSTFNRIEIYKGTVGNSPQLVNGSYIFPGDVEAVYSQSNNDFSINDVTPQPGDAFFAVVYPLFAGNEDYILTGNGTPSSGFQLLAWYWGTPMTVTADTQSVVAGNPIPSLTATLSGFIDGETLATSGITGSASCSTTATNASPVGDYPITCDRGTLSSTKYAIDTFVDGVLHITAAPATSPLTVTADDQSMQYGAAVPSLTATLSGFVNGDTPTSNDVSGAASCSTTATSASPVGTYPITCSIGTLASAAHYTFDTFVAGTLTITKAPLTVTGVNASMTYGGFVQILTAMISGFVNGDIAATSVTGNANCTTSADSTSPVGVYTITCSIGTLTSQNYSFGTFFPGLFTITKAPLTVTADNKTKTVGAAVPALTATLSGFVNGQTLATSGVTGGTLCSTPATSASPAGSYPITCSAGTLSSSNYAFTSFVAGTLTVTSPPNAVCLWALNPSTSSLQMSGSGSIKGVGCGTQVNSNDTGAVSLTGSSNINTPRNCVVGTVKKTGTSSLTTSPIANCTSKADPFVSIAKPAVPATCTYTNYSLSGSSAVTLQPGTYCGGMKFSGSGKITFAPGIYILKNGPLTVSGSSQLSGTGVSFFLTGTNAGVTGSGSGTWHLVAPTSGLLSGFVFYLDGLSTGTSASSQFSGSSSLYLEGVVYLPKQTLQFSGSGSTSASPLTAFIADSFKSSGSGAFTLTVSPSQTSVPVPAGLYVSN